METSSHINPDYTYRWFAIIALGLAATFTMIFILTIRSFPEEQHGLAVGIIVIFTGVSQAIGPTVGGLIDHR